MRRVEVYAQPKCPACDATMRWLAKHGVQRVLRSAEAYRDFLRLDLGHMRAPVVIVYQNSAAVARWSGHRPDKLQKHLLGGAQ